MSKNNNINQNAIIFKSQNV